MGLTSSQFYGTLTLVRKYSRKATNLVKRRVRLFGWFECTIIVQVIGQTHKGIRVIKGTINNSSITVWLYEDMTCTVDWGYMGLETGTFEII